MNKGKAGEPLNSLKAADSENDEKGKGRCHLNDPYLSDFIDDNTIAGINKIFRGKSNLRRLTWAIIFIGSLIVCTVMLSFSIKRFIDKPTASTITIVSNTERGIPFPAVTFCNLNLERNSSNFLLRSTYQLMNYLYNADENFHLSGLNDSYVLQLCDNVVRSSSEDILNATIWNIQNPSKTIDELIHYCGFIEGPNSEVKPCKDAFKPILTSAGICFTFNGSDNRIHSTGIRYGLKLILNIQQEKRPSFNGKSGVKLVIHNGRDIARPNLYGISVPPGHAIDVGVRKMAVEDDTNEAQCIHEMNLPFFPSDKYDYSQLACRENAIAENIAQSSKCNCVIGRPSTGPYASTPNCTFSKACCLLKEHYEFNPEEADCPSPCHFEYYEQTSSYSSFPNGFYLDTLVNKTNMSVNEIRENFLSVNVFVGDLHTTTTITQYTYGIEALLGEIGGQLGLFIGVSIITFFEVLILCIDELKRLCCRGSVKRRMKKLEKMVRLPEIDSGETDKSNEIELNSVKIIQCDKERSIKDLSPCDEDNKAVLLPIEDKSNEVGLQSIKTTEV
ncbi:PREDICTED: acid-sensing ion channel 5-like [Amphimedon queenslandica]|uniref:Uncharacterized protein n=1 Tax=Amphimedon queenslandica TaxID=400682 RepID=A0A1X7T5L4_AMPQE|nr:PREDICTED: acid-sensing ion channel 5-like [Amphimedon queenslandica]|eukprot:XP_011408195.1 PREDICTED: acid-sensing ion channel 5-like [Amphimedon queenslandica]